MVKRFGGDTLALAALLLLFGILTYRIAGQIPNGPELRPRRTTLSNRPGGLKAAYLLLQKLGLPVARCDKEPKKWPDDALVVVAATPFLNLSTPGGMWDEGQANDAIEWVEDGGTLILFFDEDNALTKKLKLSAETYLTRDATLTPQQPAPFLNGITRVKYPGTERWTKVPLDAVSLFGDRKSAVVALPRGAGIIYAVATPAVIENSSLREADNARFLAQLTANALPARTEKGEKAGRIYFDEFHQGYAEESSFWTAIGNPGQWAVYQLIAVALLAALSFGRRFGLPRPLPAPPRVSSEYVSSLADLYRRARASDAALEGVYLSFWRDLCRAAGLPLDAQTPEVASRAAVALSETGTDRVGLQKRLLELLTRCENGIAAGPKALKEPELLALSREIETVRKELGLGGDD